MELGERYEKQCPWCGEWGTLEYAQLVKPAGPHTHVKACTTPDCNYTEWANKPKNVHVRRDLKAAKRILEDSGRPRVCETCLRFEDQLPEGQVLEAHHVVEVQNGGETTLENLRWQCTRDHALIHHTRRYTACAEMCEAEYA